MLLDAFRGPLPNAQITTDVQTAGFFWENPQEHTDHADMTTSRER